MLKKADKFEFGIHETIYSNVDLELRFSWEKRTLHKIDTDNLFWIYKDDKRIGGVNICHNLMGSFFMEAPYSYDRFTVISVLNDALLQWRNDDENAIRIYGVIPEDIEHFKKLGYCIKHARRVMIRPTEVFHKIDWGKDFIIKTPTIADAPQIGKLFFESYSGGIDYEVFGQQSVEQSIKDA